MKKIRKKKKADGIEKGREIRRCLRKMDKERDAEAKTDTKDAEGLPGGPVVESLPCKARDTGSIPGPARAHMPRSS